MFTKAENIRIPHAREETQTRSIGRSRGRRLRRSSRGRSGRGRQKLSSPGGGRRGRVDRHGAAPAVGHPRAADGG